MSNAEYKLVFEVGDNADAGLLALFPVQRVTAGTDDVPPHVIVRLSGSGSAARSVLELFRGHGFRLLRDRSHRKRQVIEPALEAE